MPDAVPVPDETARTVIDPIAPRIRFTDRDDEARAIDGNRPWALRGEQMWVVRSGHLDLFSVALRGGAPRGHRVDLLRVHAGDACFGAGFAEAEARHDHAILAVAAPKTTVVTLTADDWHDAARDPAHAADAIAMLDRWIAALCLSLSPEGVQPRGREIDVSATVPLPAGTAARPAADVCWIVPIEGRPCLLGHDRLPLDPSGATPLGRGAWLGAADAARLHVHATAAILESGDDAWAGLARLHQLVVRWSAERRSQAVVTDQQRLARRVAARETTFADALSTLASATRTPAGVLQGRIAPVPVNSDAHEALLRAAQTVGRTLGLTVKPHPQRAGMPAPRDPLGAMLAASRLRARTVALRGEWWGHDHGPLLARLAEDERPVALLCTRRRGRSHYVLHDPLDGTARLVTPDIAATLTPFAHTFYRPFPDTTLGARHLLTFGAFGCKRDLLMAIGMGLVATLIGMAPSIVTASLFNDVIPGARRSELLQIGAVLVACALGTALFNIARAIALLRIEGRMGSAIQAAVWDRLLGLPIAFFRPYAAGDLAVRAMSIDAMRQVLSSSTIASVLGGIFSLGNLGLMFYYSPPMAWRALILIALAVVVTSAGTVLQLGPQRMMTRLQAKTSGFVLQVLASIAKLRVAGAEAQAFARWAQRFGEQRRLQFRARTIANRVAAFNAAFPAAAYLILFWTLMAWSDTAEPVRTGDFLAFLSAFSACQTALLTTCTGLLAAFNVIPLYEQAKPILETRPEVDVAKADPGMLSGEIEVQHAVFRYQEDGPLILRDVSVHMRPGEFVAFAGPSGSGKSTLLRLLLGFERLESGSIYFDGQEIGGLDVQALRRQIGVVLQNGRLLAGDLFTNIIGANAATLDEAWEAARMAGLADDIKRMPMGMHTVISEGGGTLSGGQRQRLLIARAIVSRPRILLFDEATSALDNRTQAIVSQSLEQLHATRIVVAHRLSTIVNADRIYLLERGRIVEQGSYAALMKQNGLFAELARRQIH
jgi:NHLM bacteriocin system ABC transporter ATP-binding protein